MALDVNGSPIRELALVTIDGKAPINSTGLMDNRLFTGENKLRAYMEPNGLWSLKYDSGILPEPLKQQFTSFSTLLRITKDYFKKRNIAIKEVID